jgi:hypothetical protein
MLVSRIAAVTIAAGAMVAGAGPAFAQTEVNPNPVVPGGAVTVDDGYGSLFCPASDTTATASSNGFVGGSITLTRGTKALVGSGKAVTTPGTYDVSITCASKLSTGPRSYFLTVSPAGPIKTGDGASMMKGGGELGGIAALAGAAGLGAFMLRRKAGARG